MFTGTPQFLWIAGWKNALEGAVTIFFYKVLNNFKENVIRRIKSLF